jgi:hypothetical protein
MWMLGAAVAIVLAAAVVWVGVRAIVAASALQTIDAEVSAVADEKTPSADPSADTVPAEGDDDISWSALGALVPRLPFLAAEAGRAATAADDPVWRAAEVIPGIGANLRTLRVVAEESDTLLSDTALPLLEAVESERAGLATAEGVDLAAVDRLADRVSTAAETARGSLLRLEVLEAEEPAGVLPATSDAAMRLTRLATAAAGALAPAADLAGAASSVLGGAGQRQYLAMFLTPAELRSSGGLPGAAAVFRAEAGAVERGEIYSTRDFSPAPAQPVLALTETELALYGNRPARLIQDTTATEDFGRAALFASALTRLHHGFTPDGVLAVDVVALAYLLDAIGPVSLASGEILDAENAPALLMNGVYLRHPDPRDQDAFFADVAERVFDAVLDGDLDPLEVLGAVARAAGEGRVLAWSADASVQSALDQLSEVGHGQSGTAALGVYLNDRTSAKMDFYLEPAASVVWTACEDTRLDQVRVGLVNVVDPGVVPSLPWYITGGGQNVPEGVISTQIIAIGPPDGSVRSTEGPEPDVVIVGEDRRPRVAWVVDLAPGEEASRTVVFTSPLTSADVPDVDSTPAVEPTIDESVGALSESCRLGG